MISTDVQWYTNRWGEPKKGSIQKTTKLWSPTIQMHRSAKFEQNNLTSCMETEDYHNLNTKSLVNQESQFIISFQAISFPLKKENFFHNHIKS